MNTCADSGGDGGASVGAGTCASSGDGVNGCSVIVVGIIGGGDVHVSDRTHTDTRLSESEEGLVVAAPSVAEVVPVVPVVVVEPGPRLIVVVIVPVTGAYTRPLFSST